MSADAMRFGIAGLGGHAESMARAIGGIDGAELVAAGSSSPERAREFAAAFGAEPAGSYRELAERDDLDVVIVATANDRHRAVTEAAFENGKHVLCEKPLALSIADAEAMAAASRAAGRELFTSFHLRFLPVVAALRQRVLSGEVGVPLDLRFSRASQFGFADRRPWRHDLARSGGGVLCDVAPHLVDLVHHVTGARVLSVSATAQPDRSSGLPDDRVHLVLTLDGGAVAQITATRDVAGAESDLHVHGSTGSLCTGSIRFVPEHELFGTRGTEQTRDVFPAADSLAASIAGVVSVLSGGRAPVASAEDGIRAVAVFDAALTSLLEHRDVAVQW